MSEIRASVPKGQWLVDPKREQGISYGSRPKVIRVGSGPKVDVADIPGHAQAMKLFHEQQGTFYRNPGTPVTDFMRRLFRKG